jgi:hypothetical protein
LLAPSANSVGTNEWTYVEATVVSLTYNHHRQKHKCLLRYGPSHLNIGHNRRRGAGFEWRHACNSFVVRKSCYDEHGLELDRMSFVFRTTPSGLSSMGLTLTIFGSSQWGGVAFGA